MLRCRSSCFPHSSFHCDTRAKQHALESTHHSFLLLSLGSCPIRGKGNVHSFSLPPKLARFGVTSRPRPTQGPRQEKNRKKRIDRSQTDAIVGPLPPFLSGRIRLDIYNEKLNNVRVHPHVHRPPVSTFFLRYFGKPVIRNQQSELIQPTRRLPVVIENYRPAGRQKE